MTTPTDSDALFDLLARVHRRIGGGVWLQTYMVNGDPEAYRVGVTWRRHYGDAGRSEERHAHAERVEEALAAVLRREDELDALIVEAVHAGRKGEAKG